VEYADDAKRENNCSSHVFMPNVQAPLFTLKARLYPQSTFVVGYDTAVRLVMPKYYDGEAGMLSQFSELRVRGCR
jgi:hypothetical protein